jgi:hypothetical protein
MKLILVAIGFGLSLYAFILVLVYFSQDKGMI